MPNNRSRARRQAKNGIGDRRKSVAAVTPHAAAMPAAQSLPGSDPSVQSGWLGGQSLSGNSSGQSGAQSGGHSGSQGGTGRSNPQIEADLSLTEHTSKTAARGHWTRAGLNITA